MAVDDKNYAVFVGKESVMESIYKDLVTFSFLCFSIWLSQGSKWWTFVTGIMFLMFTFGKMAIAFKRYNRFKTKDELRKLVDTLEEI